MPKLVNNKKYNAKLYDAVKYQDLELIVKPLSDFPISQKVEYYQNYYQIGKYSSETKYLIKAKNIIEFIIEEKGNTPSHLLYLSKVFEELKDFDSAIQTVNYLLTNPDLKHRNYHLSYLSNLYLSNEEYEKAESVFPQLSDEQYIKASIYLLLESGKYFLRVKNYNSLTKITEFKNFSSVDSLDESSMILYYNLKGVVNTTQNNFKDAVENFREMQNLAKKLFYHSKAAAAMMNIATINAYLYNSEEALHIYEETLENYNDYIGRYSRNVIKTNLANLYLSKGHPALAIKQLSSISDVKELDYNLRLLGYTQLSRAHFELGDLIRAKEYIDKYEENLKQSNKQIHHLHLYNKARLEKEDMSAIELGEKCLQYCSESQDDRTAISMLKFLKEKYTIIANYKKALFYSDRLQVLIESDSTMMRRRQIIDFEIKMALHEKDNQIEKLKIENNLKELIIQKNEQIQEQNEELKRFAHVASHDLKSPMRMVSAFSSIISSKLDKETNEELQEYLGFINSGVHRMEYLLDGLLKYSMIGTAKVEKERILLNNLIDDVIITLKYNIDKSKTKIIVGELGEVYSNRFLLMQIFQNIISNSIKFVKKGIKPKIKISSKINDNYMEVNISDNGIGIKNENIKQIFGIFERLHSKDEYEGSGLGLSITQKALNKLSGNISVKSTVGKGSSFIIKLPSI